MCRCLVVVLPTHHPRLSSLLSGKWRRRHAAWRTGMPCCRRPTMHPAIPLRRRRRCGPLNMSACRVPGLCLGGVGWVGWYAAGQNPPGHLLPPSGGQAAATGSRKEQGVVSADHPVARERECPDAVNQRATLYFAAPSFTQAYTRHMRRWSAPLQCRPGGSRGRR